MKKKLPGKKKLNLLFRKQDIRPELLKFKLN